MKILHKLSFLFLLTNSIVFGQKKQYSYQRKLSTITKQWHAIKLTDDIMSKMQQDLHDVRIFGITSQKDTIEAPYILLELKTQHFNHQTTFSIINTVKKDEGYYVTFASDEAQTINQIQLTFKESNFERFVKLEGSQDQLNWYTILDKYRILGIQNSDTYFKFTTLKFKEVKFRYFRLYIPGKDKLSLTKVGFNQFKVSKGELKNYKIIKNQNTNNKSPNQTIINITLKQPSFVNQLSFKIADSFHYLRPIKIQYLVDSVLVQKKWHKNYRMLTTSTLHSMDDQQILKFPKTKLQKLRVILTNGNNQPLNIDDIVVQGYEHELIARFTKQATYFLMYGKHDAPKPNYDIQSFKNYIPKNPLILNVGAEQQIQKQELVRREPLFSNTLWLWGILIILSILLGWFALQMVRK